MTFENFKKQFYPSKVQLEEWALREFVDYYVSGPPESKNRTCIYHALLRANIHCLEDLRDADDERVRNIRWLGEKRIVIVMELQDILRKLD